MCINPVDRRVLIWMARCFDYSMLKLGKYRHYKNKEYEVLGVAHHSETKEELVIYRALYGDYDLWVRPLAMFIEEVEVDGKKMSRFEYLEKN